MLVSRDTLPLPIELYLVLIPAGSGRLGGEGARGVGAWSWSSSGRPGRPTFRADLHGDDEDGGIARMERSLGDPVLERSERSVLCRRRTARQAPRPRDAGWPPGRCAWPPMVVAALLSLALGAALYEGLAGGRSSVAPAARFRASSHLRPGASPHKKGLSSLPLAAQGPISQALGAENPAYRVSASRGGFAAASPAQRLRMHFDRSGVSLSSGATHVGLSLRAVGYGSSLSALGPVAPRARANRVVYERAGLSEWYANGPVGLEQGFTLAKAPSGQPAGPLTLSVALSGNAHASLGFPAGRASRSATGAGPRSATAVCRPPTRGGTDCTAGLRSTPGGSCCASMHAVRAYPLRIDPFVQQGEKLTGGRGEEGYFAYSVALSPDGNTALIGGYHDNGSVGAAWIFTRASEKWTQQGAKLTGKEEAGAGEFGKSVALSKEGTYALVGGPADNEHAGAAWVFLRSGSTWSQQGPKLTGKEETGKGEFGASVALSEEVESKTYALIGGPGDNEGVGAAWVFLRTGTSLGPAGRS